MNNILISKLNKKFPNETDYLFKNINLQFEQGKIYCIIGSSGCGKTTLLKMIAGLDTDYEGKIEINGIDQKELLDFDKRSYFNKMISFIQQDDLLFDKLSIKDNYNTVNLLNSENTNPPNYLVNVNHSNNKKVAELSGGEQKRIQILEGLDKESFILLADEPTSNLDYDNSVRIMNLMREQYKKKIIIFVTHNIKIAEQFADEIIKIENGKIIKNYNKKLRKQDIKSDSATPITIKKANSSSNKFLKSEKKNNNLFIIASIVTLISLGLSLSLAFGLKSFFKNQTETANNYSYILMTQNNKIEQPTDEELDFLNSNFNDVFFYQYTSNNIITNLNNEEIILPQNLLNTPFNYLENLNDNEIVLSIDNEYRSYFEYIIDSIDLDEYLEENQLILTFNFNNEERIFNIVDVLINEDTQIEIYCSNIQLYNDLHKEDEQKIIAIEKSKINENIDTFLRSNSTYKVVSNGNYYQLYKYIHPTIDINSIQAHFENVLPIIENNNSYWINYFEGILYFNDCHFSANDSSINETIYYSPFKDNMFLGRMHEENNEIVVSSKLAEKYDLSINDYLEIKYNNKSHSYKIVGVIENNELYIYQSAPWAYEWFIEGYNPITFLLKANNYIIFEEPSKIQNTINELQSLYSSYSYYSPVKEVIDSVDEISNLIIYIGFGVAGVLLIVSILSLIILSKIEKINYQKQIYSLRCVGLQNKDLNKIYFNISYKRLLFTLLTSFLILLIITFITNYILDKSSLIKGFYLESNILIYILLFGVGLIIYSSNYLINKFK